MRSLCGRGRGQGSHLVQRLTERGPQGHLALGYIVAFLDHE